MFDQEAKTVKYYINGELDGTAKTIGNSATDEVLTLRVGSHKSAGSTDPHPMRGFIDELYVYDRALSDNEAKSLYEEKATELYKVDLNVLITEAEKLLSSGSLPEENELHVKLQEAISAAKEATSAGIPVMETLKSAKDTLTKAMENGQSYVYIEGKNKKLKKQYVRTGQTLYSTYIEVKEGVSETDWIAFPYGKAVKEGAPVKELEGSGFADQLY